MAPLVHLGPVPPPGGKAGSLSPMFKEISHRKHHIDLILACDDGSVSGHRFVLGAQSKFLKGILEAEMTGDGALEIRLPGVKVVHLKRAVKFMYTGQLKMTRREIDNEHMVWHVNHILIDLFRVDAKLNLPPQYLKPPESDEPDPPPPPPSNGRSGGVGDGSETNCDMGGPSPNKGPSKEGSGSSSPDNVSGTRQNTTVRDSSNDPRGPEDSIVSRERHASCDSDIQEVDVEREKVPTPDIIDLLDSDDEDISETNLRGNLNEESPPTLPPSSMLVCTDLSSSMPEPVTIPQAPRLLARPVEDSVFAAPTAKKVRPSFARKHTGPHRAPTDSPHDAVSPPTARGPSRAMAKKSTGPPRTPQTEDVFRQAMQEAELYLGASVAVGTVPVTVEKARDRNQNNVSIVRDSNGSNNSHLIPPTPLFQQQQLPLLPSTSSPSRSSVYRGKVRPGGLARSQATPGTGRAVRKHNHIPWTMTGLKKASTYAVVKEEKAVHACDECGAKYEKYRSLKIHKQRQHNKDARVECPEGCGKMLSTPTAIKKHLLSHRPEEEWPHQCPLCGKKFQARGDIPKHLMTKIHAMDNIPKMGTKEWFDLIYHDDPKYDYNEMKVKVEKQEARERSKLPPGFIPPSDKRSEGPAVESIVAALGPANLPELDQNNSLLTDGLNQSQVVFEDQNCVVQQMAFVEPNCVAQPVVFVDPNFPLF